jgi:nucleoside-diphosphate-sugar epimerase
MRIFVGGATGAIGAPVVRGLVGRGHEVTGTARKESSRRLLEDLGARAAALDVFDAAALRQAVAEARPEVVLDLLTALPEGGPMRARDLGPTNRVRTEGSANLLAAAIAAGTQRYVAESFFMVYGTADLGDEALTEAMEVPIVQPGRLTAPAIRAILTKERNVLDAAGKGRIEGVVLRFAAFYGPGTGLERMVALLRRRLLPVPRRARGSTPWIQIQDAARAAVLAAERGRSGSIYNVAEDEPMALADFLGTLARSVGAPQPLRVPAFLFAVAAPYLKAVLLDTRARLSNAHARSELGWEPRFRGPAEGIPATAAELRREPAAAHRLA